MSQSRWIEFTFLAVLLGPIPGVATGAEPAAPENSAPSATKGGFFQRCGKILDDCRDKLAAPVARPLLNDSSTPFAALTGGLIQAPSSNASEVHGVEAAAEQARKDASDAKARQEAVRYLSTLDCRYYPAAEAALISALRTDRVEGVRLEAAIALANGCCPTLKVLEALEICVSGSEKDGRPAERSAPVRDIAYIALNKCLARYPDAKEKDAKSVAKESTTIAAPDLTDTGRDLVERARRTAAAYPSHKEGQNSHDSLYHVIRSGADRPASAASPPVPPPTVIPPLAAGPLATAQSPAVAPLISPPTVIPPLAAGPLATAQPPADAPLILPPTLAVLPAAPPLAPGPSPAVDAPAKPPVQPQVIAFNVPEAAKALPITPGRPVAPAVIPLVDLPPASAKGSNDIAPAVVTLIPPPNAILPTPDPALPPGPLNLPAEAPNAPAANVPTGQASSEEAINAMVELLLTGTPSSERHRAIRALATHDWKHHSQIVAALCKTARLDSDRVVRVDAIRYMAALKMNLPFVVEHLKHLQKDQDEWIRQESAKAMVRLQQGP